MKKKVSAVGLMAIFALYLVRMANIEVSPAMQTFYSVFPDVSVTNVALISTLPSLIGMVVCLVSGALAGKKMSYRLLTILGTGLMMLGGVLPGFFDSFAMVLLGRVIFGVGFGLIMPLANAIVIGCYSGDKQASLLGYGMLVMNGGGVLFQQIGGRLAVAGDWHYVFFGHFMILIGFVMSFFMPEPEAAEEKESLNVKDLETEKQKISPAIYVLGIAILLFNLNVFPITMNISSYIQVARECGTAATAANASSLMTIMGCVAGLVFGMLFKKMKRYTLTLGLVLTAVGELIIYFSATSFPIILGMGVEGFGYMLACTALMGLVGMWTPPSTVAMGMSIVMTLMQLGSFLSPYWLKILGMITGEGTRWGIKGYVLYSPILTAAGFFVICTIITVFFNVYPSKKIQKS